MCCAFGVSQKAEAGWRSYESSSGIHALLRTGKAAFVRSESGTVSLISQ